MVPNLADQAHAAWTTKTSYSLVMGQVGFVASHSSSAVRSYVLPLLRQHHR